MKKLVTFLMTIVLVMAACVNLVGCKTDDLESKEATYVATSDFFYSADQGHQYGNGTKEYKVGETVYMQLKAKVQSNLDIVETINIKLTIPNITAVDSKYYDGQPITPVYDSIRNVTTYEFEIAASSNPQEWKFVFQFIPNAAAEVSMLLEFDDTVASMYDKKNTIKFVEASTEE